MDSRRTFLRMIVGGGLSVVTTAKSVAEQIGQNQQHGRVAHDAAGRASRLRPGPEVETPDIGNLRWQEVDGAKEFHLVAEPVTQLLLPSRPAKLWGFNGSAPGPTVQVNQGDRVRFVVDNHLPEPFSMHWHGLEVPFDMDGAPGASQQLILPGGRFVYEFTLTQEGTYFYHSHMAMQEMMGMIGAFIIHPKHPYDPAVDRDFAIVLQEYAILPNNPIPNSMNMEFNWLTFNGKAGPAITPMVVKQGDRVKIRLINLGMDHHPIHLHGHQFVVTGTEGGRSPKSTWFPHNTVLVSVAQARDIEFVASHLGDWMIHCHLPHHMMNAMSSTVGPMTRGPGMPAGVDMEKGMGMVTNGTASPLSPDFGPSLGRGLGVGSTSDRSTTNGPLGVDASKTKVEHMAGMQHSSADPTMHHATQSPPDAALDSQRQTHSHHHMEDMQSMGSAGIQQTGDEKQIADNANGVPGFPQDAYMESSMMAMDDIVAKPENYGLRSGWSGFVQGMMTFVRVLPPETYDHIMSMRQNQRTANS